MSVYRHAVIGMLPLRRPASLPGTVLTEENVAIDRDRLADYDRVCGFGLSDALPPTYPHVLAFPLAMRLMAAREFPFPVVGLVHVANRITVHRPIDAASRLDLAVRAVDLRPHDRGRQFDIVATASVAGEVVWEGVSTYLRREKSRTSSSGSRTSSSPPAGSATWRVPPRVGSDYARVSGDRNPIHTSRLGARLFGFPRPIAHGMWSKARCLSALAGRLPEAYTVDVAFKLPILLPATVAFDWTGTDFSLRDARSGKPHVTGSIKKHPVDIP